METEIFTIYPSSPNLKELSRIAKRLKEGALMIYPTDTVYAIGCLSTNSIALDKLARLKEIKLEKAPLSFIFKNFSDLSNYVKPFDAKVFRLLKQTLPGPYAFIMEAASKLPKPFHKRKTIGVRIVNHSVITALLSLLEAPLVTSSLHDIDKILVYTSDPDEILMQWEGSVDILINAGVCGNIPSTVIDLTQNPFKIVREGLGPVNNL